MENTKIFKEKIFSKALSLAYYKNYKEQKPTNPYDKCDRLVVDEKKSTYFFTTQKTINNLKNKA